MGNGTYPSLGFADSRLPVGWVTVDELDTLRAHLPVGSQILADVTLVPKPGVIGVFATFEGIPCFIDVTHLPNAAAEWPRSGDQVECEVLQHRPGQVRLWPLSEAVRNPIARRSTTTEEWTLVRNRHPVGATAEGTVTGVYSGRTYAVALEGGAWAGLTWLVDDEPPTVGQTDTYEVMAHLPETHRLLLRKHG